MTDRVRVDIDLLEQVAGLLISGLREREGHQALLDYDSFWSVPADQAHDLYKEPTELSVGQITECMEWLRNVANNPESAIDYHLVWLGDVLRALGQRGA